MTTTEEGRIQSPPINRRWRWLVIAIVLLIGGTLAWSYRPLTRTERRLLGEWVFRNGGTVRVICFGPSRLYLILTGVTDGGLLSHGAVERGDWSVMGGKLSLSRDERKWNSWDDFVRYLRNFADGERVAETLDLEFDADDRLWALRTLRPGVAQLASWERSSELTRPTEVRGLQQKVE